MEEPREKRDELSSTAPSDAWDENLRPGEMVELDEPVGIVITAPPNPGWANKKKASGGGEEVVRQSDNGAPTRTSPSGPEV